MRGTKFADIHTGNDLGMVQEIQKIPLPQVKKEIIEVPGRDEPLDYSSYFGKVIYDLRPCEWGYCLEGDPASRRTTEETIKRNIHGKLIKIITDDEPNYYLEGRAEVEIVSQGTFSQIRIVANCNPYFIANNKTSVKSNATSTAIKLNLENGCKRVVPLIKTTGTVRVIFNDKTFEMSEGMHTIPEIELAEGNNKITVSGNGQVEFVYRKGKL